MLSTRLLFKIYFISITVLSTNVNAFRKYTKEDVYKFREEVRQMFEHAYSSYLEHAYPYDELRPLSCDGIDTWGSYSLTLIDALDTLAVMGNFSEFQRVVGLVTAKSSFDANINVSVFETNIRIVGGLLSAHLLSHRAGLELEPGWPCNGPLLRLAEDVARRLLPAFDTPTGMPYGTVNLKTGVPVGETTITCTAGIGTFILEFGTLSRLTGDPVYEEVALNALNALHHYRSPLGLVGNHIDVATGRWTAQDSGIGAGVDSYYEYLAKGAVLLQKPELMLAFQESRVAVDRHLKRDDWHLWVTMTKGQVTLPVFQSLEAYWPGLLSLVGDVSTGMKSLHNYHQVWKQYGFTPEFYNIPQGEAGSNREGYPLRPELAESVMYLSRATGDPYLLEVGVDILRSIQHSARTPCGYATIKDTRDHRQEDRMESFFLAETTKYLYLLFDPENFIHNRGQHGTVISSNWGECVIDAGGYIFNTEAHPIDPAALRCCSEARESLVPFDLNTFRGDTLEESRAQAKNEESKTQSTNRYTSAGLETQTVVLETDVSSQSSSDVDATFSNGKEDDTEHIEKSGEDQDGESITPDMIENHDTTDAFVPADTNDTPADTNNSQTDDLIDIKIDIDQEEDGAETSDAKDNNAPILNLLNSETEDSSESTGRGEVTEITFGRKTEDHANAAQSEKRDGLLLGYQADDSEEISRVLRQSSPDGSSLHEPPTLSNIFRDLLSLPQISNKPVSKPFDPQDLLVRIREKPMYTANASWLTQYELLSCNAQPFLQRVSMSGEFFGVS